MIILFCLAISLNLFGSKTQKYGPKKFLLAGMATLVILTLTISMFLFMEITSKYVYIAIYGIGIGFTSCVGWPSCLYVVNLIKLDGFEIF
jgi:hypothetical protein